MLSNKALPAFGRIQVGLVNKLFLQPKELDWGSLQSAEAPHKQPHSIPTRDGTVVSILNAMFPVNIIDCTHNKTI